MINNLKPANMKTKIFSLVLLSLLAFTGQAQDKYGATEEQQIKCKEALSLYRTYRDQKQYDDAYMHWQKACIECPPIVTERLYSDGAKFIKHKIKQEKETDRGQVLIDSLLLMHDLRMEHFGSTEKKPDNKCVIMGMKATDLVKYRVDEYPIAYEWYAEAVGCLKEKSRASYIKNYYQLMFNLYATAENDSTKNMYRQKLLLEYLQLQKYADYGIKNSEKPKTIEGFESCKKHLDDFFIKVADDCEELDQILADYVAEDDADIERKKGALRLLNMRDCTDSPFFMEIALAVCAVDPSTECNYAIAVNYLKQKDFGQALGHFESAIDMSTEDSNMEKLYMHAGKTAAMDKQPLKATGFANKALKVNPQSGEALMLIGDVIAGSQAKCVEDKMDGRSVYWLAVDYYNRAKAMDSSLAEKVSKKIRSCKGQYPTIEQMFFIGLSEGGSFTVPCRGESTTARARG
jgi:tetratricopeptide (TPR) repeat protein